LEEENQVILDYKRNKLWDNPQKIFKVIFLKMMKKRRRRMMKNK